MEEGTYAEQPFRWKPSSGSDWQEHVYPWRPIASETYSINHYPLNTKSDDGGPWHLSKSWDKPTFARYVTSRFEGSITCNTTVNTSQSFFGYSNPSDSELIQNGAKGIAATAPTNPSFSLATALGELRKDGIPPLVSNPQEFRRRSAVARNAGSNYLNVEFGWKPLIRDVREFAQAVKDSEQILRAYKEGSGTKIRVAHGGPGEEETVVVRGGCSCRPTEANLTATGTLTFTRSTRQWFAGAFRYHVPTGPDTSDKFQNWASMSNHLLGWKVTPDTLWNIAPWSWAVDWFSSTGAVMQNISNLGTDGLVLQYGYSMGHSTRENRTSVVYTPSGHRPLYVGRVSGRTFKRRLPATPYGFGVNLKSLTAKQVAIIAALGLSKS